jgi:WD40 repeat protein
VSVEAVALDPAGKLVAGGHDDGVVSLWDAHSGLRKWELVGHEEAVRGVAFSPVRRQLATASVDGAIGMCDLEEGTSRHDFAHHEDAVLAVAFSPDGSLLASGSADGTAAVWSALDGRRLATLAHGGSVLGVTWTADGRIVTGSWDRTVRVWTATGEERSRLVSPWGEVLGVACAPDGRIAIACGLVAQVLGEDPEAPAIELRDEHGACYAVAFASDGAFLAGIGTRVIAVVADGERVVLAGHSAKIKALACRRAQVASASEDGVVRLWDLRTGRAVHVLERAPV